MPEERRRGSSMVEPIVYVGTAVKIVTTHKEDVE